MFAAINFISLLLCSALYVGLYIYSVGPAALEKKIGEKAWKRCGNIRIVSMVFFFIALANYVLYYYFPLPDLPLPRAFPWPYWLSGLIAALIGLPANYLIFRGMKDAGSEATMPDKANPMYGGIYEHIRHPQAWEFIWFFMIAFLVNSPFLVLISLVHIPIEIWMMRAEEKDLLIRFGDDYKQYMQRTGMFFPKLKS